MQVEIISLTACDIHVGPKADILNIVAKYEAITT